MYIFMQEYKDFPARYQANMDNGVQLNSTEGSRAANQLFGNENMSKHEISFAHINYWLSRRTSPFHLKKEKVQILHNMSGTFEPGSFSAIMGPSGMNHHS